MININDNNFLGPLVKFDPYPSGPESRSTAPRDKMPLVNSRVVPIVWIPKNLGGAAARQGISAWNSGSSRVGGSHLFQ